MDGVYYLWHNCFTGKFSDDTVKNQDDFIINDISDAIYDLWHLLLQGRSFNHLNCVIRDKSSFVPVFLLRDRIEFVHRINLGLHGCKGKQFI